MNMLSTKSVMKTTVFALTAFFLNQGAALAVTASASSLPIKKDVVSQLRNIAHSNGDMLLANEKSFASHLRVNSACDELGPYPHDDITDDVS